MLIMLTIALGATAYVVFESTRPRGPKNYTFSIVQTYPHDNQAFTEGLIFEDGVLYESTGLNGYSSLRRVELVTGETTKLVALEDQYFGEGITIFKNRIFQLTWISQKAFVYDKDSFDILQEFSYQGEGWGITHDSSQLIMSNGSATISFLDPNTFELTGTLWVHDGEAGISNLNELEYVNGDVYANVWHEDRIAIISIQTGEVKGWINLAGLYNTENLDPEDVLNGIAYDAVNGRLFVTGKRWAQLFEIKIESP